jgi:hypothetical protein
VPQLSKVESSRAAWLDQDSRSLVGSPGRAKAARVIVAWSPANQDGAASFGPAQIELEGQLDAPNSTTWTCQHSFESGWVEAISSAQCSEVVLTAELDDDLPAKHWVLGLAELLTLRLAPSQPLIRVRFLPPPEPPTRGPKARSKRRTTRLNLPPKR